MINFLGLESGFGNYHTNAFFKTPNSLVFIDLSGTNIKKANKLLSENLDKDIYVLITHMHADHISGIPIFTQTAFYVYEKTIKYLVPSNLEEDFKTHFKITGINDNIYEFYKLDIAVGNVFEDFNLIPIKTYHCDELVGKCFGYLINANNKSILYTGDTACISDFKDYFSKIDELYIDCSVNYGKVHVKLSEILEYLGDNSIFDVYLMHLDDIEKASEIIKEKQKYHLGNVI